MDDRTPTPTEAARRAQETARTQPEAARRMQETGRRALDATARSAGEMAGLSAETVALWTSASQRAMQEVLELSAGTAKETARLLGEFQQGMIDLVQESQVAVLRWQVGWPDVFRDPLRWYQRSLEDGIEQAQRGFRMLGGTAEAVSASVERMTRSAQEAGKGIQDAFASAASRARELHAA